MLSLANDINKLQFMIKIDEFFTIPEENAVVF